MFPDIDFLRVTLFYFSVMRTRIEILMQLIVIDASNTLSESKLKVLHTDTELLCQLN